MSRIPPWLRTCTAQYVTAQLLSGDGLTTETIRYANIVSFVCLKAMTLEGRLERKDPHDLVYCIENGPGGIEAAAAAFREQLEGKYQEAVNKCLAILKKHFLTNERIEGYLMDGPTMVANFELGEEPETREARILRQRNVSEIVEAFLNLVQPPTETVAAFEETPQ